MLLIVIIKAAHIHPIHALETEYENQSTNNDQIRKVDNRLLTLISSFIKTEIDNSTSHSLKRRHVNTLCSKTLRNKCQDSQSLDQTQHSSIAEYSLCPWRLKVNQNRYREPKQIMEAECTCPGDVEMTNVVCRNVYREMEIKIFLDGYKLRSVQDISVACVPFLLN